jgi:hypothetical protein
MEKKEVEVIQKKRIGDVINQLSSKVVPFTLNIRGEKVDVMIHPVGEETIEEYYRIVRTKEPDAFNDSMKVVAVAAIKDTDGNPAWDKPEDIKVGGPEWMTIRGALLAYVLNANLSEFEAKN